MPLINSSSYRPPFFLNNGHMLSIYPSLFRNIKLIPYKRERIDTPDGDFLDLDWSTVGSQNLAVISHGLEGSSMRPYVKAMARALNLHGWDALAWNFRSCSGEINRRLRFYHSGETEDINTIIQHLNKNKQYKKIVLVGFSLGGNMTLVYLSKYRDRLNSKISKAIVFSVPCDLADSSAELSKFKNKIYMIRFLKNFHEKIKEKMKLFPDQINDYDFKKIKNFKHYDDRYTAPLHGFKNANEYWTKCSSRQFIKDIKIPVLIVNALDDPFLAGNCYPFKEAEKSDFVYLETPQAGGHVGFVEFNKENLYWSEKRTVEFISGN